MISGFVIEIQTDNDAFRDDNREAEIAGILRQIAMDLENGTLTKDTYLYDLNGNTVGICNPNARLCE